MNSEQTPSTPESPQVSRRAAIQRGLRKGGMVAAPVLMSTLGQSAMATTAPNIPGKATTPSGFHSINASRPQADCSGQPPSHWLGVCNKNNDNTTFNTFFPSPTKLNANVTVKQCLEAAVNKTGSIDKQVAGYIAAAYYNAKNNYSHKVLPIKTGGNSAYASVEAIWFGYINGNYKPTAGASAWTSADIIEYLKSTMD